jgi:TonB family protein
MYFKKMINSMKLRNFLPLASILAAVLLLSACNSNNSDKKVGTQKAPDPEVSAEPAKPKKGKASVATRNATSEKITKDKEGIYLSAEVLPAYPGGEGVLSNYISENISYDPDAIQNNQQGTVMVSFVVDEKGDITMAKVSDKNNNVDDALEQEAIRVVSQMPKWEPGTVNGKKVKTWMHLPITFRIE